MSQTAAQDLPQWDSPTKRNETLPDGDQSSTNGYRHTIGYVYETDSDAPSIVQLPAEILILIFEQGHKDEGEYMFFSHTISSVCGYWRTLAIATPSLWSPIIFEMDELPDYPSRVRLYLERSKVFPVDIRVYGGLENFPSDDCDFLIPHLSHCRSLTIEGDVRSLYPDIKRLGSAETTLLEALHLSNLFPEVTDENPWFPPPPQALFSSPNLHTVYMDAVELDRIDVTRYFDLVNVTDFSLRWQCRIAEDHEWLPASEDPAVETFMSQIIEGMPKLRKLDLECTDASPNVIIFPLLNSLPPSLTSLKLEGISLAWELKYGDWRRRDFSRLGVLKLSFHTASDPLYSDVFTLLGMTPNVKELYVGHVDLLRIPNHRQDVQPMCLARLELFRLCAGKRTIEAFLQTLVAPALVKTTFIATPRSLSEFDSDNSEAIPEFWRFCTQVQSITLSRCSLSRNIDLPAALRDVAKNVKNLDLGGNPEWDDGLLRGLGTSPWPCPFLETVSFSYIPDLTQDALESFLRARKNGSLAGDCAAITSVAMRGCPGLRVTDALVEMVEDVRHWI